MQHRSVWLGLMKSLFVFSSSSISVWQICVLPLVPYLITRGSCQSFERGSDISRVVCLPSLLSAHRVIGLLHANLQEAHRSNWKPILQDLVMVYSQLDFVGRLSIIKFYPRQFWIRLEAHRPYYQILPL